MAPRREAQTTSLSGAVNSGRIRLKSLESRAWQPVVLPWEGAGSGRILNSLCTNESGRTSRTVRTTHQEKTCEMFMKYEKEIDKKSNMLSTVHMGFFVCLITLAVAFCHVHLTLLTWKTRVVVSEEDVYTEIIGMRNVSTTLQRVRALATLFATTMHRVTVEGLPLKPLYVEGHVYMQLYHISMQIITGLEHIRGYDASIRSATQCLGQNASLPVQVFTTSTCPLKEAINRLSLISSTLQDDLRTAVLAIKLPLSTALGERILDAYPNAWRDVHQPSAFVKDLQDDGGLQVVYDAATKYDNALYNIIHELRRQRIWPRLLQEPFVGIMVLIFVTICFVIVVQFYSGRIQRAFQICQEAVAMSDIEVQSKVNDLFNVVLTTFEYHVLPRLHPLSGLASLLTTTTELTEYHQKILKVMEKCIADLIDSSVNSLEFMAAEAEIFQPSADLADLRLIVEDCLEFFRPKASAKKLPLTCTFGTGCPSVAILDVPKVRRIFTKTLSYVLDHTYEKGLGIHVYINAHASHTSAGQEDSTILKAYDIHIEVKGLGVCMENHTAQRLVLIGGVYDRRGEGLRLLTSSRMLQSMGGLMQIQSSPSRGTFFSLAVRAKARFHLLDLHDDFDVITGKNARIVTIGLTPETKRFMSFLCKDIGIQCLHCFCFRQLLTSISEVSEVETLAIVVGDFIQISADPADKHTRSLQPQEIFEKIGEHASESTQNATTVFVTSMEGDNLTGVYRRSSAKQRSCESFIRLSSPIHTSVLIEVIVRALRGLPVENIDERMTRRPTRRTDASAGTFRSLSNPVAPALLHSRRRSSSTGAGRSTADSTFTPPNKSDFESNRRQERARPSSLRIRQPSDVMCNGIPEEAEQCKEDDSDQESEVEANSPPELTSLNSDTLRQFFFQTCSIPEELYPDVNSVIYVLNQLGLSRPVADIAVALTENPMRRDMAQSVKFADDYEVSLELWRYYHIAPSHGVDGRQTCSSEEAKECEAVFQQGTRGERNTHKYGMCQEVMRLQSKKRRDPGALMKSLVSLEVKLPPDHRVQAYFNLEYSACIDGEPLTIHQLLDWDFHVLSLSPANAVRITRDLLVHFARQADMDIPGQILMNFSVAIYENYRPNLYHNFYHALNVTQVLCLLLALPDVAAQFAPIDYLVLSVAALAHDLGHPGVNNLFMIRNNCWPARIYQNVSVLENFHAACLFQVLRDSRFNVFQSVSAASFHPIRKRIISAILWTDMAKHFDMVAKLKAKIEGEMVLTEGIIVTLTKSYLEGLLLHAADISNPMMEFRYSKEWAIRACDEFFQQNKMEEASGHLPFMPSFTAFDDYNVAKCQVSFIDFICTPLFSSLALMFPAQLGDRATQLQKNRSEWKRIMDKYAPKPVAESSSGNSS